MRTWYMSCFLGISALAAGVTFASLARAEKFTCAVPWTGETECARKFSIPAQHTLTISVTSVTDSDGEKDTEKCPIFKLRDLNGKDSDPPVATLTVCPGKSDTFKNPSTKGEVIVQMTVNIDRTFKRIISGETSVTK